MNLPSPHQGNAKNNPLPWKDENRLVTPRVLMICLGFPPSLGGIQRLVAALSNSYSRLAPIAVLAPEAPYASSFDGAQKYPIYRYKSSLIRPDGTINKMGLLTDVFRILARGSSFMKRHEFDVICCGETSLGLLLSAAALHYRCRVPWYTLAHGTDFLHIASLGQQKVLSQLLKMAQGIITNSRYTRTKVVQFAKVKPNRVHVVNFGIDASWVQDIPVDHRPRTNEDGTRVMLTVGRLVERKGHDMVIRSLPKIIARLPRLKYEIIGDGHDRTRLQQLATDLNVAEHVEFIGAIADDRLIEHYQACDLFIMPSRESLNDIEGYGLVYLEAAACGKPVIGGRSGGIRDAVVDGETGLLVDPYNVDEIGAAIITLLEDTSLAKRLGEQGRERVLQSCTSDQGALRFADVIAGQRPKVTNQALEKAR
ncbi:MAG: glycosyltransferase family 4 protein [Candidatus Marsarchaeota archaeon]|nr:glycosyltransferase family 4 protein [Candidatus Marsarchaeota archaeon]